MPKKMPGVPKTTSRPAPAVGKALAPGLAMRAAGATGGKGGASAWAKKKK